MKHFVGQPSNLRPDPIICSYPSRKCQTFVRVCCQCISRGRRSGQFDDYAPEPCPHRVTVPTSLFWNFFRISGCAILDSVQLLSQYALSIIRGEEDTLETYRFVRHRDKTATKILIPEVGDICYFLGEGKELQGALVVTKVREEIGQVTVKPVDNTEESFGGWAVWWRDITYEEPPEATDQYLYGIMDT